MMVEHQRASFGVTQVVYPDMLKNKTFSVGDQLKDSFNIKLKFEGTGDDDEEIDFDWKNNKYIQASTEDDGTDHEVGLDYCPSSETKSEICLKTRENADLIQ